MRNNTTARLREVVTDKFVIDLNMPKDYPPIEARPTEEGGVRDRFFASVAELPDEITFVTTQELEDRYPEMDSKGREYMAAKEYGAVFLMQIGGALRSGKIHDGRAPDYDDWSLNGDILLYDPLLDMSLEVSSMGIRVDPETLRKQLKIRGCEERAELPFQKALLNGELPQTIGGGIGQSRMCVYFLRKAHVGEVQASMWPDEVVEACRKANILLL